MLNPKAQERVIAWVQDACGKQSKIIRSTEKQGGRGAKKTKPIHMVSAWANKGDRGYWGRWQSMGRRMKLRLCRRLELLDIEGTIITADADECQKRNVRKIRKKGRLCNRIKGQPAQIAAGKRGEYFTAALEEPQFYNRGENM